jgi:hypothetical protein
MDYNSLQNKATNLITKYGTNITIKRYSLGTFSPTTGSYASSSTISCTVKGLIKSPASSRMGFGDRFADGTVIQAGDRELLFASSGTLTPMNGDLATVHGVDYNIVTVLPVEPGGVVLLRRALVRK